MNENKNTQVIRISLDTYILLDKIKQLQKSKNLQETGKAGDANFNNIILDLLKKKANINYQPKDGEERHIGSIGGEDAHTS